jgi:hypothetical protein
MTLSSASPGAGQPSAAPRSPEPWARSARDLYLTAMLLFVVTIVIGILNGADAVEFDRNQLLTHVHAGTVGWMSLAIVASAYLLFRAQDTILTWALAITVPGYVIAFYTGNYPFRAATGILVLLAIAWLLVWLWRSFLGSERSLPRLAVTLGLTTFAYGAVIGVLLQLQGALGVSILSGDAIGAHAGAMTFGYLVLVGMGLIEWRLRDTRGLPTAGLIQLLALFFGGLILSLGLLAGQGQAAGGLYLLTELVAVVLFVVRLGLPTLRADWLRATAGRAAATASIWVVAALLLFMYLVAQFVQSNDPNAIPLNMLIASDHATYIGVITNLVLGLLLVLAADRADRWPWADQVVFLGVNAGLLVFVAGLILDSAEVKRIGAPLMGAALLLALGLYAWRLLGSSLPAEDDPSW